MRGLSIKILVITLLILPGIHSVDCQSNQPAGNYDLPVILGYSSIVFRDSKPQDANAAILVWTEELRRKLYLDFRQKIDLSPYIFYSFQEIKSALDEDKVDILALSTPEYFALKDRYNLLPAVAGIVDDAPYSQYVLLVRKASGFTNINDLYKKTLSQPSDMYHPLIKMWVGSILGKNFRANKDTFFEKINAEEKESNAVYSVFFNKTDCAIVQKDVFKTLCSLNPQISNSLKIIETSPELISLINVYRKKSESRVKEILSWLANNIHKSAEGQNIVKLFKVKRLVEITDKELVSTKKLIDEYNKNIYKSNKPAK
ncbi:MAG: PhnD/SsuA/transferrin family substrate-binding protein [Melioribacteraceae bacterium]